MPSMQELERTSPAQLAAMCQRVADNPGAYLPEAAAQASKLKLEWNYAVQKRIEQQKDRVARRMVDFLAGIL
jgi:hypothetical protein